MEPIVYQKTPLADYLRDGGDGSDSEWAAGDSPPSRAPSSPSTLPSPPYSPSPVAPFAPSGRPLVKRRFRARSPPASRPVEPQVVSFLGAVRTRLWAALTASIHDSDHAKFLEQFRYTIIASQLLSGHSTSSHRSGPAVPTLDDRDQPLLSTEGVVVPVLGALAVAAFLNWLRGSGALSTMNRKRVALVVAALALSAFLSRAHMRRQWLRYRRDQTLSEMTALVINSRDFDSATEATLSLVQEVELVSRGYRISAPLPPISRLEDRSQNRKCVRLRKVLKDSLSDALTKYTQASSDVKALSEQTELEKYYDLYDVGDFDISDALQGFCETEFEDPESVRSLKILAARFLTTRKMILCALLALDASDEATELLRWGAAYEVLRGLNATIRAGYEGLKATLADEAAFPVPPSPKEPLSPGRERWRSQWRKLDSLSTGIRGLQAKLHLLREESDRALDGSDDISRLGPHLSSQYESIGVDLRQLMAAWEEGKAALALGIDRNERRLSSRSSMLSPTGSLSGLTTVDEGGDALDALKALTGESPLPSEAEAAEVLEAVARPRPRSLLTREERIVKMREDREQKAQARQQFDATRGMLRELESVISLRPRSRLSAPPLGGKRVTSM
ncbi:proliferating cell nuclear antigen [Ophiocordyceps camponoti-floridani]|uniref:Vezatin n=1 Tax=Ophiocordyceps camponoti-floridani TaxID=2030778 RepID=A0A8H4VAQ2_9HYPO|nr:proliferating cell nuclear antigen [Ophiocordyceps camponoti-floridani]